MRSIPVRRPTAALIARYALRALDGPTAPRPACWSPAAAWSLLALLAPTLAATGHQDPDELTALLGTDLEDAARRATALLQADHPATGLALGLWADPRRVEAGFGELALSLPPTLRGRIPNPEHAARWLAHHVGTRLPADHLAALHDEGTGLALLAGLAPALSWPAPRAVDEGMLGATAWDHIAAYRSEQEPLALWRTRSLGGLTLHAVLGRADLDPTTLRAAALAVVTGQAERLDADALDALDEQDDLPWTRHHGPDRVAARPWRIAGQGWLAEAPGLDGLGEALVSYGSEPRVIDPITVALTAAGDPPLPPTLVGPISRRSSTPRPRAGLLLRFDRPHVVVVTVGHPLRAGLPPRPALGGPDQSWSGAVLLEAWVDPAEQPA
jgi:hypothetical protein